jgi:hypothetical protein
MMRSRGAAPFVAALCLACTDAATRVAYDLEAGAKQLESSSSSSYVVDHAPSKQPEGCPGGYTLQLNKESSLLVWCQDESEGPSVSSHTTTYHLRFVHVPETYKIHKGPGEHARIALTKRAGGIFVTGVE